MAKSPVKLFIIFLVIYFMDLAMKYYSNHNPGLVFESILILFLLVILFVKYQKYRFSNASMLLVFVLLFMHSLDISKQEVLSIPVDRFIHFAGAFAAALIVSQMRQSSDKSTFSSGFYTVLITLGLASLLKIVSYLGYLAIDYSGNMLGNIISGLGECTDSIILPLSHLLGAACGAILGEFNHSHNQK